MRWPYIHHKSIHVGFCLYTDAIYSTRYPTLLACSIDRGVLREKSAFTMHIYSTGIELIIHWLQSKALFTYSTLWNFRPVWLHWCIWNQPVTSLCNGLGCHLPNSTVCSCDHDTSSLEVHFQINGTETLRCSLIPCPTKNQVNVQSLHELGSTWWRGLGKGLELQGLASNSCAHMC